MSRSQPASGRFVARVVATAGHVDHGKSTLVRALTGTDPDRLREEQARQMTIDLGFAWFDLPPSDATGGAAETQSVGLIDVPGHIDFIENMLAGVGGIDAALIVIAADEGPMPQTYEHLAILDLLRVPAAVVALTKVDLLPAPADEWIALLRADVAGLLNRTRFAGAPIVPVSARAGLGLEDLLAALGRILQDSPRRQDTGRARLPIDRVFSMAGFGTVVTGTLLGAPLAVGDDVEILPRRRLARVRGLQTHKHSLEVALPGSRVAVNLAGVDVADLVRGDVIASPGWLQPCTRLDAQIELLGEEAGRQVSAMRRPFALKHNAEVKLFCSTSERLARVRLLEGNELAPGAAGWAQLELAAPVAVAAGDRFILRLPSPSITLGGGTIVDPQPAGRYRRRAGHADPDVLARLRARLHGAPAQQLESALARLGFATRAEAAQQSALAPEAFATAWQELIAADVARTAGEVIALTTVWQRVVAAAVQHTRAYHAAQPLAAGIPRESLRSKLHLSPRDFNAALAIATAERALIDEGDTVRLPEFEIRFTPDQQRAVDALLAQMRIAPWNTPSVKECRAALGEAVFDVLLRRQVLTQVSPDVTLLHETYEQAVEQVKHIIRRDGQITVAGLRDALGTTRKYALALLEHLDQIGVTRREGDARVLR